MKMGGVVISEKTLKLVKRLNDDEMAIMYAEEAETLIDLLIEVQEQFSIVDEKSTLNHIKMLRYLAKDMNQFAQISKEGDSHE